MYIGSLKCGTTPASVADNEKVTVTCGSSGIEGLYVLITRPGENTLSLKGVTVTSSTKEVTNNYCRKPSGYESSKTIWCYTMKSSMKFEECDPVAEESIYLEVSNDTNWTSGTYDQTGDYPNAFTPFETGTTLFKHVSQT